MFKLFSIQTLFLLFIMSSCDSKNNQDNAAKADGIIADNGLKTSVSSSDSESQSYSASAVESGYDDLIEKYNEGLISSADYPRVIEYYNMLLDYFESNYSKDQLSQVGNHPLDAESILADDYEKFRKLIQCENALCGLDLGKCQDAYDKAFARRTKLGF